MLEDETNALTAKSRQFLVSKSVYVFSIVCQAAGGRFVKPGQQMEQGAFPAARRSHDRNKIV